MTWMDNVSLLARGRVQANLALRWLEIAVGEKYDPQVNNVKSAVYIILALRNVAWDRRLVLLWNFFRSGWHTDKKPMFPLAVEKCLLFLNRRLASLNALDSSRSKR